MSLDRKAMVLAVGAALAAPAAYAQVTSKAGSDWEFYGKFYPEYARIHGENSTPNGTTGLSTLLNTNGTNPAAAPAVSNSGSSNLVNRGEMLIGNSYMGFRGGKSIGGGMRAIWQVESVVPIDEGVDGTLATRNSFLGIQAGWGTVRLGFMDTPFKESGDVVGFLGVSSGNFVQTNPVLRQVGFAQGGSGPNRAARFHERRGNAFDFASPTYFGLQYVMQYSIGNPSETAITSSPPRDPRFVSQALKWESGPWYFAAMQETHFDMFGASSQFRAQRDAFVDPVAGTITPVRLASVMRNSEDPAVNSKDTAAQVTAMYKIAGHTFEADYIVKKYTENGENSGVAGRFQEYKNNAWMVAWEARWSSQYRTTVTYVSADAGTCQLFNATCSTAGLEGKQLSLGGSYYLDPSMYLFAIYSKIDNGPSARYDNVSNGAPATGEDVTQYAIGLAYNF
jgi:general bacterial porin, GBP family